MVSLKGTGASLISMILSHWSHPLSHVFLPPGGYGAQWWPVGWDDPRCHLMLAGHDTHRWVIWGGWPLTFSPQILHLDPLSRDVPLPGHLYHWSILWALSYVTYWDTTGEKYLLTLIFIKNTIFSIWYIWELLERDVEAAHPFLVVHLPSHVQLFVTPWTAARQASLSFPIYQNLLKLMSIESVVPSNPPILRHPLLLPSVLPSIRVFSNESAFHIRRPKYWSFSSIISPVHTFLKLFQTSPLHQVSLSGTCASGHCFGHLVG